MYRPAYVPIATPATAPLLKLFPEERDESASAVTGAVGIGVDDDDDGDGDEVVSGSGCVCDELVCPGGTPVLVLVLGGVIYVAGSPGRTAGIKAVSKLFVGWAAATVPEVMLVMSSGSWLDDTESPRPGIRPVSSLLDLRSDDMIRPLRA